MKWYSNSYAVKCIKGVGIKMILNVLAAVVFTFLMIIGIILFVGGIYEKIISMAIVGCVLYAVSLASAILLSKKNAKKNAKTKNNNLLESTTPQKLTLREQMYRNMKYKLTFVSGLPLMQGAVCKVVSTFDKIIIDGQGTTFELKKEKISSITIEKNITKHTQAVSSAGGALAGAMAFGVVGAAIGGKATAKDFKLKKRYIVITYFDSEENVKYIIFDYNNNGAFLVKDFELFNKDSVVKKTVEID